MQSLWITVKRCLKALKIELPYDPGIPYHGESKKKTWKDTGVHSRVHSSAIYSSQDGSNPCPSTDEQIKMCACIHTHTMEHYSTIKEDGTLPLAAMWMDLENIMPSEIKSDRERQILYHLCVESKN